MCLSSSACRFRTAPQIVQTKVVGVERTPQRVRRGTDVVSARGPTK
jgi:hypothetical protein